MKRLTRAFRLSGGRITGEFLLSIAYLPGAHREDGPMFAAIARLGPPWMEQR
jgi:DNA-3-methyladenine glycosylase I